MRRSRFGATVESNEVRSRASISDALWFDLTRPDTMDEESLCDWQDIPGLAQQQPTPPVQLRPALIY